MTLPVRYTSTAILLHWLIAVLILANLALPTIWENVADDQAGPLIDLHKSIGVSVFGLVVLRVLWRLTHPAPALPAGYKRWEVTLSHIVHGVLYLLMLGVPLAGYIMASAWKGAPENPMLLFGLVEFPQIASIMAMDAASKEELHHLFEEIHELSAWALLALVVLHVLGALKHQLLDKESELQRMWFGK